MRLSAVVLAAAAGLLSGCDTKPQPVCLPAGLTAPAAASAAGKPGPVTLYMDASLSMAGYIRGATSDVRPLQDLVLSMAGRLAPEATSVKPHLFGSKVRPLAADRLAGLATLEAYACKPGPECDNQDSALQLPFQQLAATTPDTLGVVVSDLWLSDRSLIGSSAVTLGQPLEVLLKQGRSVLVLGIRSPYAGPVYDLPGGGRFDGARERPLFVVLVGPLARVQAFRDALLSTQSPAFASGRVEQAVFSPEPVSAVKVERLRVTGGDGLRAEQVFPARAAPGVEQLRLRRSRARRPEGAATAAAAVDLTPIAQEARSGAATLAGSGEVHRLRSERALRTCDDAWSRVAEAPGVWRGLAEGRPEFVLDPAAAPLNALPPATYLIVGRLDRNVGVGPDPSTDWMRRWSFDGASEARVLARPPAMFPALNLAAVASILEAAAARATPNGGQALTEKAAIVVVET